MNTIRSPCVRLLGRSNWTFAHSLHFLWEGKDKYFCNNLLKLTAFTDCFDNVSEQVSAAVTKNQVGGLRQSLRNMFFIVCNCARTTATLRLLTQTRFRHSCGKRVLLWPCKYWDIPTVQGGGKQRKKRRILRLSLTVDKTGKQSEGGDINNYRLIKTKYKKLNCSITQLLMERKGEFI